MNKIRNMIVILLILIFILLIIMVCFFRKGATLPVNEITEAVPEKNDYGFQVVDDKIVYFTVAECVQNYLNYINPNNEIFTNKNYDEGNYEINQEEQLEHKKQIVYSLLSEDYVDRNNISEDNVLEYINNIQDYSFFVPQEMNVSYNYDLPVYVVKGIIIYNEKVENTYFIVQLDNNNSAFSIEPLLEQNYSDINEINIKKPQKNIENVGYNEYEFFDSDYETIASKYFDYYKQLALNYKEEAYSKLDEEYAKKRFGDLNNYKRYIEINKDMISEMYLSKYKVNIYDDYIEYICLDQFNNYYVFKEKDFTNYSLILDTYTLNSEEFINKYNSSENEIKVGMNIERIIQALNQKNYEYVYNKLSDKFKDDNFKTIKDFEHYVKSNFYNINFAKYTNFEEQANVYICTVLLEDATGINKNVIEKKFIVKLENNSDFIMSFNLE